jgi:hypothetical protein
MAERLATLLATQVARVRFPVPARPTFSVEKVALFFLKPCVRKNVLKHVSQVECG